VLPYMPALQPYRGKPAVRNDRGDRGKVGIIRSPVRASILPDCGGLAPPQGHFELWVVPFPHRPIGPTDITRLPTP
jgi:hypothetical protein